MRYEVEFTTKALKDLRKIQAEMQKRILEKVELMQLDLQGDVKHLTNFSPEYRLRVNDYRVLFEIEDQTLVIYRVLHRRETYRS